MCATLPVSLRWRTREEDGGTWGCVAPLGTGHCVPPLLPSSCPLGNTNHHHQCPQHTHTHTGNAAAFHLGYSWLPSFFVAEVGVSQRLSLWMLLSCMVLFTLLVPIGGALSDRGLPRVTTNIAIACVCGAIYVPTFMAFATRSLAACWALQAVHLSLVAWAMSILPVIVSRIYPAGVRISGFNLGHNCGATIGGLTPLVITAIQQATGATFLGPGVFMSFMALTSITGSLLLIKYYPDTNRVP